MLYQCLWLSVKKLKFHESFKPLFSSDFTYFNLAIMLFISISGLTASSINELLMAVFESILIIEPSTFVDFRSVNLFEKDFTSSPFIDRVEIEL